MNPSFRARPQRLARAARRVRHVLGLILLLLATAYASAEPAEYILNTHRNLANTQSTGYEYIRWYITVNVSGGGDGVWRVYRNPGETLIYSFTVANGVITAGPSGAAGQSTYTGIFGAHGGDISSPTPIWNSASTGTVNAQQVWQIGLKRPDGTWRYPMANELTLTKGPNLVTGQTGNIFEGPHNTELHFGVNPQEVPRKMGFTGDYTNHDTKLYQVFLEVNGSEVSGPHIIPAATVEDIPATETTPARKQTIPGQAEWSTVLTEPVRDIWEGKTYRIIRKRTGEAAVTIGGTGTVTVLSQSFYHTIGAAAIIGAPVINQPETPRPDPKPEQPETPGETPTPETPPPPAPTPPLTMPDIPSSPYPYDPNAPTRPGLPLGDEAATFYSAMRNALNDEDQSTTIPGIGQTQPGDLGSGTTDRGKIDEVQGVLNNALWDVQTAKAGLTEKVRQIGNVSWIPTSGIGTVSALNLGTAEIFGRQFHCNLNFGPIAGTIASIRACMLFAMAIFFTLHVVKTIREYV